MSKAKYKHANCIVTLSLSKGATAYEQRPSTARRTGPLVVTKSIKAMH